jgi:hypothetical protein
MHIMDNPENPTFTWASLVTWLIQHADSSPCKTFDVECRFIGGWHARLKGLSNWYTQLVNTVKENPTRSTALVATPTLLAAMYSLYKRNPEWFERHNRLNHMPAVSKAEFRRTMQELDAARANARNANARDDGERPRPRPARGKRAGSGRQSRNT